MQPWQLSDVTEASAKQVQLTVFTKVTRLTVRLRGASLIASLIASEATSCCLLRCGLVTL